MEEHETNVGQRGQEKLTFSNMPPGVFNGGVPVNVGEQPEAEAVLIVGRIGETIHQDAGGGGVERFAHAVVELIVHNRAPVFWFLVSNSLHICERGKGSVGSRVAPGAPPTRNRIVNWLSTVE